MTKWHWWGVNICLLVFSILFGSWAFVISHNFMIFTICVVLWFAQAALIIDTATKMVETDKLDSTLKDLKRRVEEAIHEREEEGKKEGQGNEQP